MRSQWCVDKKHELRDEMILCNIPFTSKRKMGSIVVKRETADKDHEVRVYTKGAPDMLLPKCGFSISKDGKLVPIGSKAPVPTPLLHAGEAAGHAEDTYRSFFDRTVKKFADQAFRTILVTYKDMSMEEFN